MTRFRCRHAGPSTAWRDTPHGQLFFGRWRKSPKLGSRILAVFAAMYDRSRVVFMLAIKDGEKTKSKLTHLPYLD